jgi:hypothetical protein
VKYYLLLLCTAFSFVAHADIIALGIVEKEFKFTNLNQFKGYQFSFQYQTYRYDKGYKPNGINVITIKNDSVYSTGRGTAVHIIAKDTSGKIFTSTIKVGGSDKYTHDVVSVVEVFKIISMSGTAINIKKVKEIVTRRKGGKLITKEKKAGIMPLHQQPLWFGLLIVAVCSGGILYLFKHSQKQ